MIELLFLLLPVAAGYGYIMGKNNTKSQVHQQSREIINEYSKGLKFLLDREEDQGLEHLIELLEVTADSVEHYLTLAAMFRRRGELDRAIKVHELLLKQDTIAEDDRQTIILELAQDYIMAGLLDCAEERLVFLVEKDNSEALSELIHIYQQTNDWQKGISLYQNKPALFSKHQLQAAIAHFYCEQAIKNNELNSIQPVLNISTKVVRPLYELGAFNFKNKNYLKAINYWQDVLKLSPKHAPLFLDDLKLCYQELNLEKQYLQLLEEHLNNSGVLLKIHYCELLLKNNNKQKAIDFLTQSLKRQPNIRGFSYLLDILSDHSHEIKHVLTQVNELVQSYIQTKSEFQCKHCGFESHTMYWFCPSCKHWESVVPNHGLDGF